MDKKIFGILGSGLLMFSFLPGISMVLIFLGTVLTGISVYLYDKKEAINKYIFGAILIFISNMLYYFKLVAVISTVVLALFHSKATEVDLFTRDFFFGVIIYFVIYFILQIAGFLYFKSAFGILSSKYNNDYFKIAGYLLVAGSIISIFLIGQIFVLIGWLLVLIGFAVLDEKELKLLEKK